MIHGEDAHSCYFSRDCFEKLSGDNKELYIITAYKPDPKEWNDDLKELVNFKHWENTTY